MYGSLMCIHRYELGQTRHRRKKRVTELVPFKHVNYLTLKQKELFVKDLQHCSEHATQSHNLRQNKEKNGKHGNMNALGKERKIMRTECKKKEREENLPL